MNSVIALDRAARRHPDRVAVWLGASPWATYRELAERAARVAGGLRARGLGRGDRVAVVLDNRPEYLVALYGIWWAGMAAVPVNVKLHAKEVAFIAGHSGARLVIDDAATVAALGRAEAVAPAVPDAGDLAWLFYTSGTTGRPKGAMLSHRNLAQMTLGYYADLDRVPEAGRLLHAAPMSHGSGLYHLTHLARGASQVIPESGGVDPDEMLALLEAHREVSLFAAPTMVKRLAAAARESGARAPGLRMLVYGGGPMYLADLDEAMAVFGPRFAQIYGQGESPMTITVLDLDHHRDAGHPRHRERLASVGVANSVVEVAVRDGDDRELPPGEPGEICVRGDVVMSGYWSDPEASARALAGGWLHTGDVGVFDADGFLTLKDRSKDLIVSGGSNIYPREVEEVLLRHPAVAEAGVVGAPDPDWGERVVAFIVPRGEAPSVEALDRLCLDHIARYKRPKEYRFLERLPKNHYGKIVKTELRALLAAKT